MGNDARIPQKLNGEIFLYGDLLVILGYPNDLPVAEESHNCDEMGCSSTGFHVIHHVSVELIGKNLLPVKTIVNDMYAKADAWETDPLSPKASDALRLYADEIKDCFT